MNVSSPSANISFTSAPLSARNFTISASIPCSPVNIAAANGVCSASNQHFRFMSAPFSRISSRNGIFPDFTAIIIASSYTAPAFIRDTIIDGEMLRVPLIRKSFTCIKAVYVSGVYPASLFVFTSAPRSMSHFTTLGLLAVTARNRGLYPFMSSALISAPQSERNLMSFFFPFTTAAVNPSPERAPCSSNTCIAS